MKKMINKVKVEGLAYENKIELKTVQNPESKNNGMQYYRGKLHILTGDNNVVAVDFWENALTKDGNPNKKFGTLTAFLANLKTVLDDGQDVATPVSIGSSQIGLNEWYREDGVLVSTAQNSGGFINSVERTKLNPQATFELDVMIISNVRGINASTGEENDFLTVQACAFDYKGAILPMTFSVFNPNGIKYFESMAPNTFTKIWGKQISSAYNQERITENAFGEPLVEIVEKTIKHFEITGCNTIAYDETQLTAQEWNTACANREITKAELKSRQEKQKAQKSQISTAPAAGVTGNAFSGFSAANAGGDFNF